MGIKYIQQEKPQQCLKGDVHIGKGFRAGRGTISRIYIATATSKRLCCVTQDTGRGRLVEYLLEHVGESINRETLSQVSNLQMSTIKDYMRGLMYAFTHSQYYELRYDFRTKRYTLAQR